MLRCAPWNRGFGRRIEVGCISGMWARDLNRKGVSIIEESSLTGRCVKGDMSDEPLLTDICLVESTLFMRL